MTADRDLTFEDLEIGGLGTIGGNGKGRNVEVGGKFSVHGSLELSGKLEVGGTISVGEALTGNVLEVGGRIDARRAIFAADAEVGGAVSTREGLKASRITLRRKSRAAGPLVGGTIRIGAKATVEDLYGDLVELEEKAEARRVVARRVVLGDGATADQVVYTDSVELKAGARVRTPPQKVASLPAFPI